METLHYRLPRRIRTARQKCTPVAAAALGNKSMNQVIGGRGLPGSSPTYSKNECACIRCKVMVFCRSCGYFVHGRLRRQCPVHPRVMFLFDITCCPNCKSSSFLEEH